MIYCTAVCTGVQCALIKIAVERLALVLSFEVQSISFALKNVREEERKTTRKKVILQCDVRNAREGLTRGGQVRWAEMPREVIN